MMNRNLFFCLCIAIVLSACSNSTTNNAEFDRADGEDETVKLIDDMGTELVFNSTPERIGCLTEICVDTLKQLGLTPAAVAGDGITSEPEFFGNEATSIPTIGGSFFEPNVEDIFLQELDLVIGLGGVHENIREALGDKIPLYIVSPETYEDSIQFVMALGQALDKEAEAEQAVQSFKTHFETQINRVTEKRTALIMYGSDTNFGIDTQTSVVGSMIKKIANYPWKTDNGDGGHSSGSAQLSLEEILKQDPDILFVETFRFGDDSPSLSEQLASNPVWGELKAVKTDDVHEVRTNIWANGRGIGSLTIILDEAMELLYPDLES
ncbi:ABC transporter substrate-binding protein [Pseudalkalibacillus salsuginis]|uniref:ABC transporter substrate-binding protein n=1 Tax=Pseudalkalibacillus salsuginis TaxID=2910972 RepID=UPI001F1C432D|nr:ABC transporter substrate-binding protein [Pseudalkalibacillus salsuginis]MCF6410754.1 ABC transporter substrate-binding protein [Pseudalkalibacillus salsuginis]